MSPTMPPATPDPAAFEQAKDAFLAGLADLQAGHLDAAEAAFERSLALVPGRVSTLVNLAATRLALGRPQDALRTAAEVLAVEPTNADAFFHRAGALRALGRPAEALAALEAALAQRGDWVQAWFQQGQSLLDLHRPVDALASLDRALALAPDFAAAWSGRGDILRDMGRLAEARTAYEQALAHGADAELMRYCLAGLGQSSLPATAPRAYVEALFDGYAGDFEQHVVQALRYRAPEVLAAPLPQLHPLPFRSALDLGCGTGLCGPLLRPMAGRLVGVDLSLRMLDQARARGDYDELVHGDIVQHLHDTHEPHDLVIAADVFIYLGDLAPVFAQLARLMPAGALFCFSAEAANAVAPAEPGFTLQSSLRYAHHESYLRRLAAQHGFEPLSVTRQTVREEQRQPIEGMFVHLRRLS